MKDISPEVVVEIWDIDKVHPYANNAKKHTAPGVKQMADSIARFGWTYPLLVDENGELLAGHKRLLACKQLGLSKVPVIVKVGLSDAEKKAYRIADNKITENSEWVDDLLKIELADLQAFDFDLRFTGFSQNELASIFGTNAIAKDVDAEPKLSKAGELQVKWNTKTNQLWRLGDHLLLIGDSTEAQDVMRVLQGEQPDMVATDPPYGVDYVGKTGDALPVHNDDAEGLYDLLNDSLGLAHEACRPGAVWYVAAPAGPRFYDFATVLTGLGVWRQTLVWVKDSMVLGHSDFHYQHEAIFYGWKDGAAHHAPPNREQKTVWQIDRPKASREHPTMKPVELYDKMLWLSSEEGDLVYEPFAGSGTTLLSCERMGRKCRAIEVAPEYAAVVLQRWVDATGKQPELVEE